MVQAQEPYLRFTMDGNGLTFPILSLVNLILSSIRIANHCVEINFEVQQQKPIP
jgi:hypothetical protein